MQKGDLTREFTVHVMLSEKTGREIDSQLVDTQSHPAWDWKDSGDRHITMAKLGHLYPHEIDQVDKILQRVASRHAPFKMSLDSPVTFDKRIVNTGKGKKGRKKPKEHKHPFVLWARPDPRGWTRLANLFKTMAGCLGRGGFSYGYSPARFQAHTTIARAASDQEQEVQDYVDVKRRWQSSDFEITGFALREFYARNHPNHPDHNGGIGSRFKTVKTYQLSGN